MTNQPIDGDAHQLSETLQHLLNIFRAVEPGYALDKASLELIRNQLSVSLELHQSFTRELELLRSSITSRIQFAGGSLQ